MYNISMKKTGISLCVTAFLLALSLILNILAWKSRTFSDLYTNRIFPALTTGYGKLTSRVSFSVGEILLIVLVIIVLLILVLALIRLIFFFMRKEPSRGFRKFSRGYFRFLLVLFSAVFLIMTLNCFVLYHCTPLAAAPKVPEEHTIDELATLRDYIVNKCNSLSEEMPRDEKGHVVYEGDMTETAKAAMLGIYMPVTLI